MRVIELPQSRVFVEGGSLFKTTLKQEVLATFRLGEIRAVNLRRAADVAALVTFLLFGAFCAAAKIFIGSTLWSLVVAIPLGLISLIALAAVWELRLVLETERGPVAFEVHEDRETAAAFLHSLKGLIEEEAKLRRLTE